MISMQPCSWIGAVSPTDIAPPLISPHLLFILALAGAVGMILIYGGAILVTYVFVIMLAAEATPTRSGIGAEQATDHDQISREPILASAIGFALIGIFLFVIFDRAPLQSIKPAAIPPA